MQNRTKIVKFSELLRIVLLIGFLVWAFAFGSCLIPWLVVYPKMPHLYAIQSYVAAGVILQPVFGFMVNLKLFQFFSRLKSGRLFDQQTVNYLSVAGRWWMAYWVYQIVFLGIRTLFFHVAMSWDFACLFGALTLVFGAWLLKEAQALQAEQELTV